MSTMVNPLAVDFELLLLLFVVLLAKAEELEESLNSPVSSPMRSGGGVA